VAVPALLQVAEDRPEGEGRPERGGDVVADVAGVVGDGGGDEEQEGRGQRAPPSQPAAQEVREGHQDGAHNGDGQPGREVAIAEEEVGQGDQMEVQRPVHHRVVLESQPGVEVPGELAVQALVVALDPVPQHYQPGDQANQDDEQVEPLLAGDRNPRQDGTVQPGFRFGLAHWANSVFLPRRHKDTKKFNINQKWPLCLRVFVVYAFFTTKTQRHEEI
jgi:hypothetical protein